MENRLGLLYSYNGESIYCYQAIGNIIQDFECWGKTANFEHFPLTGKNQDEYYAPHYFSSSKKWAWFLSQPKNETTIYPKTADKSIEIIRKIVKLTNAKIE